MQDGVKLERKTKDELKQIAQGLGIEKISALKKDEIIYFDVGGAGGDCTLPGPNPLFGAECSGGYNGGGTSISSNLDNDNAGRVCLT